MGRKEVSEALTRRSSHYFPNKTGATPPRCRKRSSGLSVRRSSSVGDRRSAEVAPANGDAADSAGTADAANTTAAG